MSGVIITIKHDDAKVKTLLTTLKERTGNLTPVMKDIGQIVRNSVIQNFISSGRPQKWKPNAFATIMGGLGRKDFTKKGTVRKPSSRRLSKGKVLIDTARLQNSITSRAFSDHVDIGTNVIYAAIHQFGGPAGRELNVTIPARPFLMIQKEDKTAFRVAVENFLMKGVK
jgi:phage virion morphogenesis protein